MNESFKRVVLGEMAPSISMARNWARAPSIAGWSLSDDEPRSGSESVSTKFDDIAKPSAFYRHAF